MNDLESLVLGHDQTAKVEVSSVTELVEEGRLERERVRLLPALG